MKKNIVEVLAETLPPVFARKDLNKLTGGLINPRTMCNLDSKGLGVPGKVRLGKKLVAYERESFLEWLEKRIQPVHQK